MPSFLVSNGQNMHIAFFYAQKLIFAPFGMLVLDTNIVRRDVHGYKQKGVNMGKDIQEMLLNVFCKGLEAKNELDKTDEDKKAENKKAKNEDVDKRDIIRQIMAIAGKEEASEDVKTIAKLAEKLAYDKSEAGTADNSKAKNEEEDEDKKDDKEKAENKCKNENGEEEYEALKEKTAKEAENKKAKNALDEIKRVFFEGEYKNPTRYISQKEGIELGKKLY